MSSSVIKIYRVRPLSRRGARDRAISAAHDLRRSANCPQYTASEVARSAVTTDNSSAVLGGTLIADGSNERGQGADWANVPLGISFHSRRLPLFCSEIICVNLRNPCQNSSKNYDIALAVFQSAS